MFDLAGKVALVTGGNGGIGLGMAKGLAQAGARVVIAARNTQKSAAAVEALKALGSDALALAADVKDEASVAALFAQVAERCGRLDILVNNAGTNIRKPVEQMALAEWNQVMDTNLTSAFLCSRAAYPHFKAAGGGKIINIGSMMSIFGASFAPAYAASKGGIVQLTKSLAASWALDGIQVNAVLPGWIETELTEGARAQVAGLHERVVARTPVGRWGQPQHLAGVAVFLASAASDFVTGTAIPVDGGYSIAG
ncbi:MULTISPECIES: SDR family NAD(P)-dependent oxidoreductase [unclassified Variovorax]|uniref:SDR family NAD(P)-dependent oxidoreductase n=1 Tax=unclassified Variovorax TaxID=663243 RepID=UPI001BD224DC|nr:MULTISPECIES: glucose 1-dehydrogenase [unclassified Variovorax]